MRKKYNDLLERLREAESATSVLNTIVRGKAPLGATYENNHESRLDREEAFTKALSKDLDALNRRFNSLLDHLGIEYNEEPKGWQKKDD